MPPLLDKTTDQRIVHHGTWEQFKFIQKGFEGSPGVRLFYYLAEALPITMRKTAICASQRSTERSRRSQRFAIAFK
jgi:hypothetical protein